MNNIWAHTQILWAYGNGIRSQSKKECLYMSQNPYYPPPPYQGYPTSVSDNLAQETIAVIEPAFRHGLKEISFAPLPHVLKETAAISYLLGKGYDFNTAYQTVESWEQMGFRI
jgi:hypothetical protein